MKYKMVEFNMAKIFKLLSGRIHLVQCNCQFRVLHVSTYAVSLYLYILIGIQVI